MSKIDCHTYLASTPFSDNMTDRRRIAESMEKFDLEALVLVSSLGIECDMLNGNKQLRAIVNADAGIYAYVTVNSEYTEQSIEQQRTYLTRPEFVGAVFVSPIGRSLHLDDVYEIANAQRRYGKPLVFRARNAEDIDGIRGIAQEFSKIPIIILSNGNDGWRSSVEAAKKYVNIHLEISGSLDADKISHAYSSIAARRLLFGSGLPTAEPSLYANLVDESKVLTTTDRNRIFRQNASMLLHINE